MKNKQLYILIAALGILVGCQQKRNYFPAPQEMEEQHITIHRIDSELLNIDPKDAKAGVEHLYEQYPDFMPFFVQYIWGYQTDNMDTLANIVKSYLEDTTEFGHATRIEQIQFHQIDDIQQSVNQSFTRLHYLYPDLEMPEVYFFVSGFSLSNCLIDNHTICIGTDMYLGSNYGAYNQLYNVNNYQLTTMQRNYIPVDVMKLYLRYNISYYCNNNRLLDMMISEGKLMFLCRQLMEDAKDWELIGYSPEQWQWCEYYEDKIWRCIMDNKDPINQTRDLYSTNTQLITDYIHDGPFTLPVSQDSPSKLGVWIGWRIIQNYMDHHPEVGLVELMEEQDAQKILNLSEYRP